MQLLSLILIGRWIVIYTLASPIQCLNNRALKPIALKMKYPAVVVRRIFNPNFASRDNSNPKNNLVNYILEVR